MEEEFKPLEPCFIGPIKVRALSATDKGKGWASPCPQIYLNIGDVGAVIIGCGSVEELRDMCNHALSAGEWNTSPPVKKPCTLYTHKWEPDSNTTFICKNCKETATEAGLQPVAIHYLLYDKLKKAGELERRTYLIYWSESEIKKLGKKIHGKS